MDPALVKQRELFKKAALSNPVVEKKREQKSSFPPKKKQKTSQSSLLASIKSTSDPYSYKAKGATSQNNFSILAKIVKHMKQRHLEGDTHPLTLEEILDETKQLDISSKQRHWLETEALCGNPKVHVTQDKTYFFKPAYNLKSGKTLKNLLDKHDTSGLGGILLEDVEESLSNPAKALKLFSDVISIVIRPNDKKKVLFYTDRAIEFKLDEPIIKLWRSIAVEGIDEMKIEEYLNNQGISSMQGLEQPKKPVIQRRKKSSAKKKQRQANKSNTHLTDILEDYSHKD